MESTETSENGCTEVSSAMVESNTAATAFSVGFCYPVQPSPIMDVSESSKGCRRLDTCFDKTAFHSDSCLKANMTSIKESCHDALATIASSSCRDLEKEVEPMDILNISNSTAEHETNDELPSQSEIEPLVSSAIDSGLRTTRDSPGRREADPGGVEAVTTGTVLGDASQPQVTTSLETSTHIQLESGGELSFVGESNHAETAATSVPDYFIQMPDASGQLVTSIIDPGDLPLYTDSVVYKHCLKQDGGIETTVVYSSDTEVSQEGKHQPINIEEINSLQEHPQTINIEETDIYNEHPKPVSTEVTDSGHEQQVIYAPDLNGQLTPIDPIKSANDIAPPGKQFVYMQDSIGRIIRTLMDASQNMVPGQQVYYTQSEDGQLITSVMESTPIGMSEDSDQEQQLMQQSLEGEDKAEAQQLQSVVEADVQQLQQGDGFNTDNRNGLSMLAELSHITAGQGLAAEEGAASGTDSNSTDMDEFRPVAFVTKRVTSEETVSSSMAQLKVGPEESLIAKMVSLMRSELAHPSCTVSRDNLFVQWQNLDAMCWMDVVLVMLVYSPTLRPLVNLDPTHELASTLLITLLKANRQAQALLQNLLKKTNGAVVSDSQIGAGSPVSVQDPKNSKLVCKENVDEIGKAINILYAMREKIWQALQPRLRCERGKHNSPVLVLPLLIREKPAIKQMFTMTYRYVFKCEKCSYTQDDSHSKILPSIPTVPEDFSMSAPCFVRNCFECQAPNQRMMMKFERLQDFVQIHFVNGLPHNRFEELSFDLNGDHYEVTSVVCYKNNPDHFIAWVRNAPGSGWMECDDLKSVITRYLPVPPNIPPSQIHMVMWERRLTLQHMLVMRDTEDTKLLASLVLTVQQPNTHQSVTSETRLTSPPEATSQAVSSFDPSPGLVTQTFTPYIPRGNGHGREGTGGRNQAALMPIPSLRRVSAATTQPTSIALSSNPQTQSNSHVVHLPLSALAGPGLNLRAGTPSGARFMLVGNRSPAGAAVRAGVANKVVVVKSQGGAANLSRSQLLQLLQNSGVISQLGATTTATLATSQANFAAHSAATTSILLHQEGSISASSQAKELPGNNVHAEQMTSQPPSTNCLTETVICDMEGPDTQDQTSANQNISTLPFFGTADPRSDLATYSTSITKAETTLVTSFNEESASEQTVTISQGQQSARYIQIPNPAGEGMLLYQLSVRDGKVLLVPASKSSQTSVAHVFNAPKVTIQIPSSSSQLVSSPGVILAEIQKQVQQRLNTRADASTSCRLISLSDTASRENVELITGPHAQTDQSVDLLDQQPGMITLPHGDNVSHCTTSGSPGQLLSSPAVSLLKDMPARQAASSAKSLLVTSPSRLPKSLESFRFVLPGSNTTHILHTEASDILGGPGQTGTFTALSSSETIVGGQMTPSASSTLLDESSCKSSLTCEKSLAEEFDTKEYTMLGRGRAHGVRGGRGRRGQGTRGRRKLHVWNADAELLSSVSESSGKMSLLADQRNIGAQMKEVGSESDDGLPAVSVPATELSGQTVDKTIDKHIQEISSSFHSHSALALGDVEQNTFTLSKPRVKGQQVVAQPIPSVHIKHAIEVLTQDVHGYHNTGRTPPPIQARSLLTGNTVTLQPASSLVTSWSKTTTSALASRASPALNIPGAIIEALKSKSQPMLTDAALEDTSRLVQASSQLNRIGLNDSVTAGEITLNDQNVCIDRGVSERLSQEMELDSTMMSIDESKESAAERYKMPLELFQPDEESPEKSLKLDTSSKLAVGLTSEGSREVNIEPCGEETPTTAEFLPSTDDLVNKSKKPEAETDMAQRLAAVTVFDDMNVTSKKVHRPRGRRKSTISKRKDGRKIGESRRAAECIDTNNKSHSNGAPVVASTTSASLTEEAFPEASPDKDSSSVSILTVPLQNVMLEATNIVGLVTDSLAEISGKRAELAGEGSTVNSLDNHEITELTLNLTSETAGRRGRRSSISKQQRGGRKSHFSEINKNTLIPDTKVSSGSSTESACKTSPHKESVQPSLSGDPAKFSKLISDEINHTSKEEVNNSIDIGHAGEHDGESEDILVSEVGRKSRKKLSRGRGRQKSNNLMSESVKFPSDLAISNSGSSTCARISNPETERLQQLSSTNLAKIFSPETEYLQQSFSTDIAQISNPENEHLQQSSSTGAAQISRESDSIDKTQQKLHKNKEIEVKHEKKRVLLSDRKPNLDTDKLKVVEKPPLSPASVYCRKRTANWDTASGENQPCSSSTYRVLKSRPGMTSRRHPSLGPVQEYYVKPPSLLEQSKPRRRLTPGLSLKAVVTRQKPKYLQKLTAEAPNPGSGNGLTRQVKADWSCSSDQKEVTKYLKGQELKTAKRQYCRQHLTTFYMVAAVNDLDVIQSAEERNIGKIQKKKGTDTVGELDGSVSGIIVGEFNPSLCSSSVQPVSQSEGRRKRPYHLQASVPSLPDKMIVSQSENRKRPYSHSLQANVPSQSDKVMVSQSEGRKKGPNNHSLLPVTSHSSVIALSSKIVCSPDAKTLPVNVTDTKSQDSLQQPPSGTRKRAQLQAVPSSSPARRSGRTPIPSKKVVDMLEKTDHLFQKIRRVAKSSSQVKQAGPSKGLAPPKKLNKK